MKIRQIKYLFGAGKSMIAVINATDCIEVLQFLNNEKLKAVGGYNNTRSGKIFENLF